MTKNIDKLIQSEKIGEHIILETKEKDSEQNKIKQPYLNE